MNNQISIAQIKHEIRNHLNNLSLSLELAKVSLPENEESRKAMRCIEKAMSECKACSNLIQTVNSD